MNRLYVLNDADSWGAWVVQSVKHPTPDLGSGHDLIACEFEPRVGLCADSSVWSLLWILYLLLSLSLSAPPPLGLILSLSLSLSKIN